MAEQQNNTITIPTNISDVIGSIVQTINEVSATGAVNKKLAGNVIGNLDAFKTIVSHINSTDVNIWSNIKNIKNSLNIDTNGKSEIVTNTQSILSTLLKADLSVQDSVAAPKFNTIKRDIDGKLSILKEVKKYVLGEGDTVGILIKDGTGYKVSDAFSIPDFSADNSNNPNAKTIIDNAFNSVQNFLDAIGKAGTDENGDGLSYNSTLNFDWKNTVKKAINTKLSILKDVKAFIYKDDGSGLFTDIELKNLNSIYMVPSFTKDANGTKAITGAFTNVQSFLTAVGEAGSGLVYTEKLTNFNWNDTTKTNKDEEGNETTEVITGVKKLLINKLKILKDIKGFIYKDDGSGLFTDVELKNLNSAYIVPDFSKGKNGEIAINGAFTNVQSFLTAVGEAGSSLAYTEKLTGFNWNDTTKTNKDEEGNETTEVITGVKKLLINKLKILKDVKGFLYKDDKGLFIDADLQKLNGDYNIQVPNLEVIKTAFSNVNSFLTAVMETKIYMERFSNSIADDAITNLKSYIGNIKKTIGAFSALFDKDAAGKINYNSPIKTPVPAVVQIILSGIKNSLDKVIDDKNIPKLKKNSMEMLKELSRKYEGTSKEAKDGLKDLLKVFPKLSTSLLELLKQDKSGGMITNTTPSEIEFLLSYIRGSLEPIFNFPYEEIGGKRIIDIIREKDGVSSDISELSNKLKDVIIKGITNTSKEINKIPQIQDIDISDIEKKLSMIGYALLAVELGIKELIFDEKQANQVSAIAESVKNTLKSAGDIAKQVAKFEQTNVPDESKLKAAVQSSIIVVETIVKELQKINIDDKTLETVSSKVKPITEIIEGMTKISTAMNSLAAVGMIGIVKYKFAIVNLLQTIDLIQTSLSNFEFNKETMNQMAYMEKTVNSMSVIANKLMIVGLISFVVNKMSVVLKEFISLCVTLCVELSNINIPEESVSQIENAEKAFSAIYEISKQLIIIALLSPFIWMFKKPILSSIDLIVDICAKLADLEDVSENAKNAAIVGKSLAEFAKGILVFVIASMGGLVFLLAIVALYPLKWFMGVFTKLFNKETLEKIKEAETVIGGLSKTLLILSGVIVLWMLVGVLLVEAWKYVLITTAFVFVSMAILIGLGWMQQFIKKGEESLMMLAKVMVVISMTVLLWALTGLLIQEEWPYLIVVVAFVAIAIGFMMWLNKSFKEVTSGGKTILVLSLVLMTISLTVLLWALTGEIIYEHWEDILVVGGFVTGIIVLMLILSKAKNTIIKGGMSILLLAASILVLSLAIGLMAVIGEKVIENIGGIGITLGVIIAIVGVYAVIGIPAVAMFVGLGAAVMAIVAASILVFSVGLLVLVGVSKIVDWEDLGKMAAIITSIGFAVSLLGPLSPFIILGSAAMLTLGVALLVFMTPLLMFSGVIKLFKSIDATKEDIERPIVLMGDLITSIFKNIGIKSLLIPIAASIMLSLLPVVLSLSAMTQVIESLANLRIATKFDKNGNPIDFREMNEVDFINAGRNIETIMTSIITALSDPKTRKKLLSLKSKAIENIGDVLSAMSGLKNIVDVVQQMAHMSVATAWNSEGKPIKFTKISEQQRADAITNAITLMTEFLAGISSETVINNLEDMNRRSRQALESVMSSCSGLKNLVDAVKEVSKYDNAKIITEVGKVGTFVSKYIEVYNNITGEKGIKSNKITEERFETFKDFIEETKNFTSIKTDALKTNVDSFTTFVDKANSIDTDKIKTVKDMFAEMTELSKSMKGDFDKLADVLSDKLVVVLEKLQETISGIPTDISVNQNTMSKNNSTNTFTSNTQTKQQTQANTLQPQNNDKINKNLVDIKDSLDDMILLLTSVKNNTDNL
jgi:hypothetical protein